MEENVSTINPLQETAPRDDVDDLIFREENWLASDR